MKEAVTKVIDSHDTLTEEGFDGAFQTFLERFWNGTKSVLQPELITSTTLLNTQHYKVRFKGKVEQSWEGAPSPTSVSCV